ncbi:MAG: PEP-CTERM system TPR-repeat protein PrsT [Candidatus Thiodiazotropha sp.]
MNSSSHPIKFRLLFICTLGVALIISGCNLFTSNEDRFSQAVEYREKGKLNAAVIEFKNVLKEEPEHAQARWLLGKTYLEMNDGLSAKKELERARELGVNDDQLTIALAQAYVKTGEPDEALRLIESTPSLANDARGLAVSGEAQLAQNSFAQAKQSFQAGLRADSENIDVRYGLIRVALSEKEFAEAGTQIDALLSKSPDDFQGLIFKAELALNQANPQLAIDTYQRALKSNDILLVHMGLARAYLADNNAKDADIQLDMVLEKVPNNLAALYLKAVSATHRKDFQSAKGLLQEVLVKSPDHYPSMLMLGVVQFNLGEYEQAANNLVSYLAEDLSNVRAKKLLAQTYLKLGDTQRAIERLESAADSAPNDPGLLGMLGNLYTSIGDYTTGQGYYERSLKLAPGTKEIETRMAINRWASGQHDEAISDLSTIVASDREYMPAEIALITAQMQAKNYTQALDLSRNMIDKHPELPLAYVLAASALDAMQKRAEARDYLERAIKADPAYINSYLMLARFDHEAGKGELAKAQLEAALAQKPTHERALLMLAKLEEQAGNTDRVRELVEKARVGNPQALTPRVLLANANLRQGKLDVARRMIDEALEIAPDNGRVLMLEAEIARAVGDSARALEVYEKLVSLNPLLLEARLKLGTLKTQMGDLQGARDIFSAVVEQDSKHLGANWALGDLELKLGHVKRAMSQAELLLKAHPEHSAGYSLKGDVLMQQAQYDSAAAIYRKALDLTGDRIMLIKAANALKAQGKSGESIALLDQWLEKHPDDTKVRISYAAQLQVLGRIDEALSQYQSTLEQEPDNVVVLNNLAWLYQQQGQLEKARGLAEKAHANAPEAAGVIDTLGWILVNSGELERGLQLLEKAVERGGDQAADIRYHLAAAHARAGNSGRARSDLETLLASDTQFAEREAASKLLESLK